MCMSDTTHPDTYRVEGEGTMHERDVIDRSAKHGARSGERSDEEERMEHDETVVGQTTFNPEEGDDVERWKELADRHHERYSHTKNSRRQREHVYDAKLVASQLEFTDYQTEELVRRLTSVDQTNLGPQPSYEALILSLATLIANHDGRWLRRNDDDVGDDCAETFEKLRKEFDVRRGTIRRLRKRLR